MDIRAAVFHQDGSVTLETVQLSPPRTGEIVVRILSAGVCQTDLKVAHGGLMALPAVLGHEGVGIVEQVGDEVTGVSLGDRVVMSFDYCGPCPSCLGNRPSYCTQFKQLNFGGRRLDGSSALSNEAGPLNAHFFGQSCFTTHAVCRSRNVVKVPDHIPDELLPRAARLRHPDGCRCGA